VDCEDNCEKYLIMGFGFSPKIVTDGLVLYMDAANRKSFVPGSAQWTDISTGDIGSFNNQSPYIEWTDEKGGSFNIDGSLNTVDISLELDKTISFSDTDERTIEFVARRTGAGASAGRCLCGNGTSNEFLQHWRVSDTEFYFRFRDTTASFSAFDSILDNYDEWFMASFVFNSDRSIDLYYNGVYSSSVTAATTVQNITRIASGYALGGSSFLPWLGYFASTKVYNRALSTDELSQNYNALRGRFFTGLVTEGLIAHYDAKDKRSHPGNTLRWNDVSGNNYNMTLDTSLIPHNSDTGTFTLDGGGASYLAGSFTTATTCTAVIWLKTTDAQSSFLEGQSATYIGLYTSSNKESHANSGSPDFYMDLIERPNIYDYAIDGNWHMFEFKNVDFSAWTELNFNQLGSYYFANGEVAIISIYDRNLTAAESAQNFTAFRTRFGI
jgi:hypothetical protein